MWETRKKKLPKHSASQLALSFKYNSCTETLNSTWRHFRHLSVPNNKMAAILVPQTGPVAYKRAPGWRSGESTHLPPMWPGFRSRRRHHMWVEFVVRSLPKKPTLPNSNSIWNARTQFNEFSRTSKCYVGKQITNYNLNFFNAFFCTNIF